MKFLKQINGFSLHSLSLRNRLWLIQVVLIFILLSSIYSILFAADVIKVFNNDFYKLFTKQLNDSAKEISQKYSSISANTIELASRINKGIEDTLSQEDLTVSDMKSHPELLETLLGNQVEKAVFTMQKTGISGVFVFLDATINPKLDSAFDSKAGFYIIDMDPNTMPYTSKSLFLLYGPPKIARSNGMYLHTEWELEYNTGIYNDKNSTCMYNIPFAAALKNKGAKLQDLGYWNNFFKPAENGEQAMSYSVPLIDRNGVPYGVCGLEISKAFFEKIMPVPISPLSDHITLLFSMLDSNGINTRNAGIISDNPAWLPQHIKDYISLTQVRTDKTGLKYYTNNTEEDDIVGMDTKVSLYPSKSVFRDETWVLAAFMPAKDILKTKQKVYAFALFFGIFILGIIFSYYTSRHYVMPIVNTLNRIKEYGLPAKRTNILEIDDFIEFLKQHPYEFAENVHTDTVYVNASTPLLPTPDMNSLQFEEFTNRLNTLSKAEREVFDLYIKGHTAKEISQLLFISINTIKSHNKKIYSKMNVNSRVELLAYCYKLMGENNSQQV